MTDRRRGYALVEVLVVMTIVATMLTLCAGMIHLLLKLDHANRSGSEVAADLSRLARDFREDAHASGSVDPPGQAVDRLTMPIADKKTVEYQIRPKDILRTVREGEKVRRYEVYRTPARAVVRIERTNDGPRTFLCLVIDRPLDGRDDSLYRYYRIEAELGKDRRMTPRPE
jgi:prepilin-type N-terminal cleavage/methylation domain-containing protein